MLVQFDSLPESSKIWIYQASRVMSDDEVKFILENSEKFVESWTAHQAGLKAGVKILFNAFILFAVDESHNDASGCSIDKKVHYIKGIEQQTGLQFFDRMKAAYKISDNEIGISPLSEMNNLIHSGKLNLNTVVFNNLVKNIHEFKVDWQIPLKDSWMINFVERNHAG